MFFFMPETAFYGARASTQIIGIEPAQAIQEDVKTGNPEKTPEAKTEMTSGSDTEASIIAVPKLSYLQTLKPWGVINPYVSLKKSFLRPWVLLA
jgi:hypothetical protein